MDSWSSDGDRAQAMGILLAIVDAMREYTVVEGTDPNVVRSLFADLVERVAEKEFGDWASFKKFVRERVSRG